MGDSDDEKDDSSSAPNLQLAGFLFGNVDEKGQLENDILDPESKRQLSSLFKLGFGTLLQEVIGDDSQNINKPHRRDSTECNVDSESSGDEHDEKLEHKNLENNVDLDDGDYSVKSPTAVDYSDITELADDDIPAIFQKMQMENHQSQSEYGTDYDADDESPVPPQNDMQLMPPPPLPTSEQKDGDNKSATAAGKDTTGVAGESAEARQHRFETPLAAMLPSKYEGVDVKELFPDFRADKVLRFSRLFGPGKVSSLPQLWRSARKRAHKHRRRHRELKEHTSDSGSEGDSGDRRRHRGWTLLFAPPPNVEQCASDDEEKLLRPVEQTPTTAQSGETGEGPDMGPRVADWRFGPAQIWYDMLDVPETGDGFNYGFKLQEKIELSDDEEDKEEFPDDAFLMVSQLHWEDDVVWNGDDIKHKVLAKLNSKTNAAGWVPTSGNRTAQTFSQPGKGVPQFVTGTPSNMPGGLRLSTTNTPGGITVMGTSPQQASMQQLQTKGSGKSSGLAVKSGQQSGHQALQQEADDTWYSIFPVENEELVYGAWEEEVIWDAEAMPFIPKPKILTLDPNDENIVLGIPNDVDPSKIPDRSAAPVKVKIPHPHVKKSKLLLGKAGVINVLEQDDAPPPPPKALTDMDPFNISNDKFYQPRHSESALRLGGGGGNLIQHSTPVVELRAPFVPTHMGPMKLRNFHRPPLRRFSNGPLSHPSPHSVHPLLKHIRRKAKSREQERAASGGGDVFFMRTPEDLTGKDGDLILIEFCEEHPPLMNQVGMCSKVKNYYKRKAGKDQGPQQYQYGEVAYAHTSPFLGTLPPGHSIQAVENNMYRAPIYEHLMPETDFLVIRTRHQFFVREVDALFVAGQECPLYEVPGPNSKRANNFVRDFLQVFIYRLFWRSRDTPRRIRMDDIKRAFPSHSESSIRKRLKQCADFKRTGMDSNWWVIKPEFRLPTEEEIRAMVSPEQCCAYFSMIAAEQRLKDAGYGEKFLLTPQEDGDDEELQLKMDDEVKVAPWNTTRAYVQAMKNKCLLQLAGPADPTGCGEGFSYVRMPNKPTQSKEEQEAQPKRTVTGTDADLRRLSLNNAKALLRKFQVPEEEIKKLSRWEVIDVVRTLSTEKAKAGEEGMTKFSRGNRFSIAEHQERYKEECQRIFELQNRVLASNEVLSTDEGESSDEDSSDIEEMGKNIENMLANKKTSTQLSLEKEEQERQELRKLIMGGSAALQDSQDSRPGDGKRRVAHRAKESMAASTAAPPEDDTSLQGFSSQPGRVLKIYRTFRNQEGKEYTRVEIVRKAAVVDAYTKIRSTKDDAFIRQFATLDDQQKEEMKREKRRIQEQLRRIKRNQEKEKTVTHTPKRKKPKLKPDLKLKCGACGQVGHMRTNKACPQYQAATPAPPVNVALTEEQEEEIEKQLNTDDDEALVNVDGTKVKLSSKLFKHVEEIKRRSLLLRVPKDAVSARKRRRAGTVVHCDYLKRQQRPANRRRTDPVVTMSTMLETILNEMRDLPDVQPFLFPVNGKVVPDYYTIIHRPMDLQTIRDNLRGKKYQNREEFLTDVNQIVENSTLYNGAKSALTMAATRMWDLCVQRISEKEDKFMRLEKAINPLLDDNDQVAFTFILDNIINNKLKAMSESWPFQKPVNKKMVKDYYEIVKHPMDLETVAKKVKAHKYHDRHEFLADIELVYTNCLLYNGRDSPFTQKAEILLRTSQALLDEYGEHLSQLEASIKIAQERALENADMDSLTSLGADDENYTIVEPDRSQAGSPDGTESSRQPEFMFVDVEGDLGEASDMRSMKRNVLEEDLGEISSEDDEGDEDGHRRSSLALTEGGPDDSQQVAEAMVQLGNFGYFAQPAQDESMDVDPEYDPSDFLQLGRPRAVPVVAFEAEDVPAVAAEDTTPVQTHHFPVTGFAEELNSSQLHPPGDADGLQPVVQGHASGIGADLEVSDSDEESKIKIEESKLEEEDGGDLWF